ncbi:unnamed protein product [Clonostachys rosea]|uniref:Ig-like domain-containing protein n=1 Tax=Bionectria ochroleuca TaxID=29856 RepID=A0ABY6TPW1_BIOOC|nr:unnamed protein product [Clonostachys rosea]
MLPRLMLLGGLPLAAQAFTPAVVPKDVSAVKRFDFKEAVAVHEVRHFKTATPISSVTPTPTVVTPTPTLTLTSYSTYTVTKCPETVTNCPVGHVSTVTVTWCPASSDIHTLPGGNVCVGSGCGVPSTAAPGVSTTGGNSPNQPKPTGGNSGNQPQPSGSSPSIPQTTGGNSPNQPSKPTGGNQPQTTGGNSPSQPQQSQPPTWGSNSTIVPLPGTSQSLTTSFTSKNSPNAPTTGVTPAPTSAAFANAPAFVAVFAGALLATLL